MHVTRGRTSLNFQPDICFHQILIDISIRILIVRVALSYQQPPPLPHEMYTRIDVPPTPTQGLVVTSGSHLGLSVDVGATVEQQLDDVRTSAFVSPHEWGDTVLTNNDVCEGTWKCGTKPNVESASKH